MASISAIEADIRNSINEALRKTAEELTFQIESAYENAIDKFYSHYQPRHYSRTYSTYLASSGYNNFVGNIKKSGDAYIAGITVNSGLIGSPYKANPAWVFERTFSRGIHGYTATEAKEWSSREGNPHFSPTGRMMRPTPEVIMNKEFRHITRASNIDSLFKSFYNA